jgi:acylphosphatase
MRVKEKHLLFSGRVQGVGFRHFTKVNAKELNITGWVRNLSDGRVEVLLQGEESTLNTMVSRLKKGPRSAVVENLTTDRETETDEPHQTFFVKR